MDNRHSNNQSDDGDGHRHYKSEGWEIVVVYKGGQRTKEARPILVTDGVDSDGCMQALGEEGQQFRIHVGDVYGSLEAAEAAIGQGVQP